MFLVINIKMSKSTFFPKNRKYTKIFKFRLDKQKLFTNKTLTLNYGNYGIKALESGILTTKHFLMLQLLIRKGLKKKGQFLFRKYPYTFLTKKPAEVRMGKGKGNFSTWICPIFLGQIIIEFSVINLNFFSMLNLLRKCIKRLPIKSCIITTKFGILQKNLEFNYSTLTN